MPRTPKSAFISIMNKIRKANRASYEILANKMKQWSTFTETVDEGEDDTDLGEESPPLPVLQLEVAGTVPLYDLHCSQLLLAFAERSENTIIQ